MEKALVRYDIHLRYLHSIWNQIVKKGEDLQIAFPDLTIALDRFIVDPNSRTMNDHLDIFLAMSVLPELGSPTNATNNFSPKKYHAWKLEGK